MVHKAFFAVFGLLSFLIVFLQVTAVRLDLYFELPWLDILMHILGGIWIACVIFALYTFFMMNRNIVPTRASFLSLLVPTVLGVAIAWELLELYTHVTNMHDVAYWPDTISDMLFGLTGGILGSVGLISHYKLR